MSRTLLSLIDLEKLQIIVGSNIASMCKTSHLIHSQHLQCRLGLVWIRRTGDLCLNALIVLVDITSD